MVTIEAMKKVYIYISVYSFDASEEPTMKAFLNSKSPALRRSLVRGLALVRAEGR